MKNDLLGAGAGARADGGRLTVKTGLPLQTVASWRLSCDSEIDDVLLPLPTLPATSVVFTAFTFFCVFIPCFLVNESKGSVLALCKCMLQEKEYRAELI